MMTTIPDDAEGLLSILNEFGTALAERSKFAQCDAAAIELLERVRLAFDVLLTEREQGRGALRRIENSQVAYGYICRRGLGQSQTDAIVNTAAALGVTQEHVNHIRTSRVHRRTRAIAKALYAQLVHVESGGTYDVVESKDGGWIVTKIDQKRRKRGDIGTS
jgi:hypothetical protein